MSFLLVTIILDWWKMVVSDWLFIIGWVVQPPFGNWHLLRNVVWWRESVAPCVSFVVGDRLQCVLLHHFIGDRNKVIIDTTSWFRWIFIYPVYILVVSWNKEKVLLYTVSKWSKNARVAKCKSVPTTRGKPRHPAGMLFTCYILLIKSQILPEISSFLSTHISMTCILLTFHLQNSSFDFCVRIFYKIPCIRVSENWNMTGASVKLLFYHGRSLWDGSFLHLPCYFWEE